MPHTQSPGREPTLSVFDAVVILVGIVVGIGIFRTPSLVAAHVESEAAFIAVWVAGGAVTLVGALCYAELAAAHPHAGGEYHFLSRAYGRPVAMLFGWARGTVIQTGAIAGVAFVLGDYAAHALPAGPHGPALYAALAVIVLTGVNVAGTFQGKTLQIAVTILEIAAILAIIAFGLSGTATPPVPPAETAPAQAAGLGMAMIFVLLTYGGWNEASYLTGELRDAQRSIPRVLLAGTAFIVALYVLVNLALLMVLGLEGLRASPAVAADMMQRVAGPAGAGLVTAAIVVAAVSTLNATIFTGARTCAAMAEDITVLARLGRWSGRGRTPANGLLAQGAIALALVGLGAVTQDGFRAMVDYTAPVFWAFLLLVGIALFVLRRREPRRVLPYRVPLYPLTPLLFCLTCLYMLHASIAYTGMGALAGLAVVAAGTPLLLFRRREEREPAATLPAGKAALSRPTR
ncbi:APC family permease [Teichococcus aestuarii]|uniref:Amino acid permease n=1 Tax=Teichococcus aestuarii TaxID=568898 RepID=A0A2U1VAR0_9PROT|nr:APC family permease [Pseudoroseomonas aestuarii]PWC30905.1 amino acid permease [Pseudoroseomonas aestuarii]